MFSRNFYRFGLLGRFIGLGHFVARRYGVDPSDLLRARSVEEQREFFRESLAPLFQRRLVRWVLSRRFSLFGLGIPPAQHEALAAAGHGDVSAAVYERLERLSCGFAIEQNYFAWQAFGRGYSRDFRGPLPPYLRNEHFEVLKERAGRVEVLHGSFTDYLRSQADGSVDRFVLLDAQDWMSDAQLNALWCEITRTAGPGARVIFRTAAAPSVLPGRVANDLLARWRYEAARSEALSKRDRSAIYADFISMYSKAEQATRPLSAPDAMDRMYRHQRFVYDATRKFYLLGRDRLIRGLKPGTGHHVLELGCGTGRNLVLAAKRYPAARFYGLDISEAMLRTARSSIERAGGSDRIAVAAGDATAFDAELLFERARFDRVFISYSLSMIPSWRLVIARAIALLAPGGELHVVDFGDQRRLPRWFGRALLRWLALFHVTPRNDLPLQMQVYADHAGSELTVQALFGGYGQYAVLSAMPALR